MIYDLFERAAGIAPPDRFFNSLKNERVQGAREEARATVGLFADIELFYNYVDVVLPLGHASLFAFLPNWHKRNTSGSLRRDASAVAAKYRGKLILNEGRSCK